RDALDRLTSDSFEVVVTDMQMPEMDGMKLIEAMRLDYPQIPAILITGRGSESIAADALQIGAAGYVPKERLGELLCNTIVEVLGAIRADASFAELIGKLDRNVFEFTLPNDAELVSPLVGLIMQIGSGLGLGGTLDLVRFGTAVEHAVVNSMYRGNLQLGPSVTPPHHDLIYGGATSDLISRRQTSDPYDERRVSVSIDATRQQIDVTIKDDGSGFDLSKLPDPSQPGSLDADNGRGLVLMRSFTDVCEFTPPGNEVRLIKRFADQQTEANG
ncbi:MAG: response regulator, partial [Planctomycetota bacterium]